MSKWKKLAKRLRMFKHFDEATIVAAVTATTMDYSYLEATDEGMERLYNICKKIDEKSTENEHTKGTSPTKRTKEQVFELFLDQFLKGPKKYGFRQSLEQFEVGIGNYLSIRKDMLRGSDVQLRDSYLAKIDNF